MERARFIQSATQLRPLALVPELSLYQASDIYAVWELTEQATGQAGLAPPFWGVAWPGGQALARFLLDHPDLVAGRSVLDVGSGSGLVALAAERAGAAVSAVEPDDLAAAAMELNAAANGLPVPLRLTDIAAAGRTDVVVAGDVWYEKALAALVTGYLTAVTKAGSLVLAGDIGRRYFPRRDFEPLACYQLPTTIALEGRESISATVWRPAWQSQP